MKKKIIWICAAVLVMTLALFAFTACNSSEDVGKELIVNGNFSDFPDKSFEGWSTYSTATGSFTYAQGVNSNSSDGSESYYVRMTNSAKAYSYLQQTVKVDTNKIYKVSFDLRVIDSALNHDYGAYIAFLENVEYKFKYTTKPSNSLVTYTFYVRPKNTDYLTLALCLGSEEEGCSGTVNFANVSMQMVNKSDVPEGEDIVNFRKAVQLDNSSSVGGVLFVVLLTLFGVALLVFVYVLLRRLYASKNVLVDIGQSYTPYANRGAGKVSSGKWYHNGIFIAAMLALGAFVVRLVLLLTTYGMGTTTTSLLTAAKALGSTGGVSKYMANNPNSTLAPGAMYILAVIGAMSGGLDDIGLSIMLRFINVLADMAVVLMIYFYGKKKVGNRLSTIYAALYAVLPFVFVMSGINGTFESLLVALLLAAVLLMIDKQYLATYFVMTLAAVLDIRALAIAPIIVAYFVYMYIKDNDDKRKFTPHRAAIVFGLVGSFVLAYLLTLPVGINQIAAGDAFFNFKVIVGELTHNNIFVSNAFNLYGMVAMNGKTMSNGVTILNFIFLLVLEAYAISLYFKNRNKQELILLISFVLAVIAVFTVKVNYTYLFLSIAFALIYTMISGDKRMYIITSGYALLGFLDIAQLLNQSGLVGYNVTKAALISYETTYPFYIAFSVIAVLLTGYFVYVCYSITNNSKIVDIKPMREGVGVTLKKFFKR